MDTHGTWFSTTDMPNDAPVFYPMHQWFEEEPKRYRRSLWTQPLPVVTAEQVRRLADQMRALNITDTFAVVHPRALAPLPTVTWGPDGIRVTMDTDLT